MHGIRAARLVEFIQRPFRAWRAKRCICSCVRRPLNSPLISVRYLRSSETGSPKTSSPDRASQNNDRPDPQTLVPKRHGIFLIVYVSTIICPLDCACARASESVFQRCRPPTKVSEPADLLITIMWRWFFVDGRLPTRPEAMPSRTQRPRPGTLAEQ